MKKPRAALDSAVFHLFLPSDSYFKSLTPINIKVNLANENQTIDTAKGKASLQCGSNNINLHDALFTESIPTPLILVPLLSKDFTIVIRENKFNVLPHDSVTSNTAPIASGTSNDGILKFNTHPVPVIYKATSTSCFAILQKYQLLHNTFNRKNHRDVQKYDNFHPQLQKLIQRNEGFSLITFTPCHQAKQIASAHPKIPPTIYTEPLQNLSADTAGPLPKSKEENRYFTVLIDVLSKRYTLLPTKTKSSADLGTKLVNAVTT